MPDGMVVTAPAQVQKPIVEEVVEPVVESIFEPVPAAETKSPVKKTTAKKKTKSKKK